MDVDLRRQAESGRLQHRRPEERVEIRDVLADEVVDLGRRAAPPVVETLAVAVAPLPGRGQVADRGVEPHVPVIARTVGNLEAEIRRRPRHVPVVQRLAEEMALQIIGHLALQRPALGDPLVLEEPVQPLDVDEQVAGGADLRLRAESVLTGSIRSVGL